MIGRGTNMQDRRTDELRWLPTETLRGEWDALCHQLSKILEIRSARADLAPYGLGHLTLAHASMHLVEIDRCLMMCCATDPLFRRTIGKDDLEITLCFRAWWRRTVPFLMDPEGDRDNYVFERIEAHGPPVMY